MRKGKVLYENYFAGTIAETDDGEYIFQYDEKYVKEHPGKFITFSLPVRNEPYDVLKKTVSRVIAVVFAGKVLTHIKLH